MRNVKRRDHHVLVARTNQGRECGASQFAALWSTAMPARSVRTASTILARRSCRMRVKHSDSARAFDAFMPIVAGSAGIAGCRCAIGLCLSFAVLAASPASAVAAGPFGTAHEDAGDRRGSLRAVRDVRIAYARPFGFAPFEDPARNLTVLEAAARELTDAVPGPGTIGNVLVPLSLRRFGVNLISADALVAPEGESAPPPELAAPAEMRRLGASGVFSDVLLSYATRAREAAADASRAMAEREALLRFAQVLESQAREHVYLSSLEVTVGVSGGCLVAPTGTGDLTMTLPAIAEFGLIRDDALRAIASQVEQALENRFAVQSADGGMRPLSLTVQVASPSESPDSTLLFRVAFVGPRDQPSVPVASVTLAYVDGAGKPIADPAALGLPDPNELLDATRVELRRTEQDGVPFLADFGEGEIVSYCPGSGSSPARLSVGSLRALAEGVLAALQSRDLMGVYVDIAGGQFDMSTGGRDMRGGDESLKLVVIPGIVGDVRVVASGERVEGESEVNPSAARYERVLKNSPFGAGDGVASGILRSSELDDYLHRLSRHPNRRADAAVTPPPADAKEVGGVMPTIGLDYLIRENKPWSVFVQGSNTGTGSTGEWQERLGVFHSDLFGNDEILSIEYLTTDFESMHSVNAYFDARVGDSEILRWKVYGSWYEYSASDVGLSGQGFEGSSPTAGAELALTVFQRGRLFVDIVGGARWFNVKVNNLFIDLRGEEDFLVPYIGARVQRNARSATTDVGVFFDACLPDATDVDPVDMNRLGRLLPERDWKLLRWDLAQSFYLDPLFVENAADGTLAHELAFRFRGQHSFDERLIPQQLGVAGGFYTVRGYPESIVAGDTLLLASAEYRLHLPQIFGFDSNPQPLFGMGEPFRLRPQFGYGTTDWDLILRGFVDVGVVDIASPFSFERNDTLVGAGVGIELQFRRNLDLRLDLGFPLNELEGRDIDSARVSFVGTLAF
jgi:hemolysin activation/secretion protein